MIDRYLDIRESAKKTGFKVSEIESMIRREEISAFFVISKKSLEDHRPSDNTDALFYGIERYGYIRLFSEYVADIFSPKGYAEVTELPFLDCKDNDPIFVKRTWSYNNVGKNCLIISNPVKVQKNCITVSETEITRMASIKNVNSKVSTDIVDHLQAISSSNHDRVSDELKAMCHALSVLIESVQISPKEAIRKWLLSRYSEYKPDRTVKNPKFTIARSTIDKMAFLLNWKKPNKKIKSNKQVG